MRTVGVRKYSKEGGENSGNPLRRFRSHEMKQHAITAKGNHGERQRSRCTAGRQERACHSATEAQWQSCLICNLTIHCLPYTHTLSSRTHLSSSPSSPSLFSSRSVAAAVRLVRLASPIQSLITPSGSSTKAISYYFLYFPSDVTKISSSFLTCLCFITCGTISSRPAFVCTA